MPVDEAPIDLARQHHQRVLQIENLVQCRPEQVLLTLVARLAHRSSLRPETRGSESRSGAEGNPKSQGSDRPNIDSLRILITSNPARLAQAQRLRNSSRATKQSRAAHPLRIGSLRSP